MLQNKTETIIHKTEVTTPTELLSQFHTTRDLVRVLKTFAESLASKYTFKSGRTLKEELVVPKDKDHITKKSGVFTRLNVIGWNVMRSTLVKHQEHLERDTENI